MYSMKNQTQAKYVNEKRYMIHFSTPKSKTESTTSDEIVEDIEESTVEITSEGFEENSPLEDSTGSSLEEITLPENDEVTVETSNSTMQTNSIVDSEEPPVIDSTDNDEIQ